MKKLFILTLILLSGMGAAASTATGGRTQQPADGKLKPRLKAVDTSKYDNPSPRLARLKRATADATAAPARLQTPRMEAQAQKRSLDRIECTVSSTGEPYSLQEFKFDSHGWPVSRVNSLYDTATKEYQAAENYGFEWNEDGLCSSQWQTSDLYQIGIRYDYKYNDRNLGIEQVYYEYDFTGDNGWTALQKNEYKYDDRGNIIEETVYTKDATSGQWTPYSKAKAAWDDRGLQTLYEPYLWDGAAWQGVDEKQEYTWADKDHMTQCKSYTWQDGGWVYYVNLENDFDENLNLTRREKRFYNQELGNWNGCCTWNGSYYENERSLSEYDGNGRILSAKSYTMTDAATGEWTLGAWETHSWTALDNGSWQDEYMGYLGNETEYTESYGGTEILDNAGRQTYILDKMYDYTQGKLLNDYERVTTYNGNGDILTEKTYSFKTDEANTRQGDLWVENEYDEHYNITGTINRNGGSTGIPLGAPALQGTSGEGGDTYDDGIDWQYSSKFEYFYEQDTVRVKKLGYRWQDGQWTMNQGEATTYDFDTPIEDIIAWPGLNTYHTIAQTSSLIVGSTDDWYVFDYKYSDFTSGIQGPAAGGGNGVRIWPTLVDDGFNVEAPDGTEVCVYSMTGARVAQAVPGHVSMSGMPRGVYIVTAGGTKTKIVKK